MVDMLRVGVIASTHGIRGEVKVFPTTDDVKRFEMLKEVILDLEQSKITLKIEHVKFFKNMAILKFKGMDSINEVEKYKGKDLLVSREHAVKLEENEHFIADLLGLRVITDKGKVLGILDDVLQTGANDVYVVKDEQGTEILLPVIEECVLDIDLEQNKILVHIMEGLLD